MLVFFCFFALLSASEFVASNSVTNSGFGVQSFPSDGQTTYDGSGGGLSGFGGGSNQGFGHSVMISIGQPIGSANQGGLQEGSLISSLASGGQSFVGGSTSDIFDNTRPVNQGFGNSRPLNQGSDFSSRPGQGFASERPLSHGLSNGRPFSQGSGGGDSFNHVSNSERPFYQGSSNHRPSGQSGLNSGGFPEFTGFDNEGQNSQGFGNTQSGTNGQGPSGIFGSDRDRKRPEGNSGGQGLSGFSGSDRDSKRPGVNSAGSGLSGSGKDRERPSDGRPSGQSGSVHKIPTNGGNINDSYGSISSSSGSNSNSGSGGSGGKRPTKPNRGASNKPLHQGGSGSREPSRRLLPDGKCGIEISDKIIGGENAGLDEFPWMALLHFSTKSGQERGFGCGGSLINDRYVLTAAHCIKGSSLPSDVVVDIVRLGEYDVTKDQDCINGVCSPSPIDAQVEEIIVHPEYQPSERAQYHDIALIRLRKKVPFSAYISPICLPNNDLRGKDYSGKRLLVAGWGKTANGVQGRSSPTKQKVSLPFVTLQNCKPFYEGIKINLRNTQMCAGGEEARDSCQGDSGGPLMSTETSNGQSGWFAMGIVSFGPEDCGVRNIAGVYTKVSDYIPWILETIKE